MTGVTQELGRAKANNVVGIRCFDYVEFYVGSATMMTFWFVQGMGFKSVAFKGPETGCRDKISFYLQKGDIKIIVTSPISKDSEIQDFIRLHGEGVKRFAYEVDDVKKAYGYAVEHGGKKLKEPETLEDENGKVQEAAIAIYDDTEIVFVNYDEFKGIFQPGFGNAVQDYNINATDTHLLYIDHIVGNVRESEMNKWAEYFNSVLGFETYVHFGPGDISTKFSALLSKVVRSKDNVIKNPINEPYDGLRKSQIQEYIDQYNGSGVQHIAIAADDIIASISALRKNGIQFLKVPDTYYDELRKHADRIDENIDELQKHGILCDLDKNGKGYLLQLFTKPVGDRPTFFFEIIQRKYGSESFGQGNFQSLFEAIEADQEKRGNI